MLLKLGARDMFFKDPCLFVKPRVRRHQRRETAPLSNYKSQSDSFSRLSPPTRGSDTANEGLVGSRRGVDKKQIEYDSARGLCVAGKRREIIDHSQANMNGRTESLVAGGSPAWRNLQVERKEGKATLLGTTRNSNIQFSIQRVLPSARR